MVMPLLLEGLGEIQSRWKWIFFWGTMLTCLGLLAVAFPFIVSLSTAVFIGWMILLGGVLELGTAFHARGWQGVLFYLMVGALDIFFGLLVISRPAEALAYSRC